MTGKSFGMVPVDFGTEFRRAYAFEQSRRTISFAHTALQFDWLVIACGVLARVAKELDYIHYTSRDDDSLL